MKREDLEELTKESLKEKADALGIKLHSLDSKGTIIDKIMGNASGGERPKQPNAPMPPVGALFDLQGNKLDCKMYRLKIFSTETDKNPVDLIVNSHNLRIMRDVEVIVAEPYIELLRNAIVETVRQDPDTGKMIPMQLQQFPHQAQPV